MAYSNPVSIVAADKKLPSALLAIFLGGLGIHKFYYGATNAGLVMLICTLAGGALSFLTCGITAILPSVMGVIGFIEGIIYLTKSDSDFYNRYQIMHQPWF
jgi:TM2 domain-containing membrane protein YozV